MSLADTYCLTRWGESGFGWRRAADRGRICDRRCRGLFDQHGPKWSHVDGDRDRDEPNLDSRPDTDTTTPEAPV